MILYSENHETSSIKNILHYTSLQQHLFQELLPQPRIRAYFKTREAAALFMSLVALIWASYFYSETAQ